MRVKDIKLFRADGGWRPFSFLKLETDDDLSGWSEFSEAPWSPALDDVIRALAGHILGEDPRQFARLSAKLQALTLFTAGGLSQQAIAAIENACIDIAAKAASLPVHALFGGPFRTEVDLYWSHCGSFRVSHPDLFETVLGLPRLTTLDDVTALGEEAVARGYRAAKTNPIVFGSEGPRLLNPGFGADGLAFERTIDEATLRSLTDQTAALRDGLGPDAGYMFDVNFGFRPTALRSIAAAIAPSRPTWLEADLHDPAALADVRAGSAVPLASLESIYGRRNYRTYLDARAADIAVIDIPWNGFTEAVRIANLAESYEINVAPHNFYGPLADLMSAQFCAAVGNVAIMEHEGDDVPWKYDLLTERPVIENGRMTVPTGIGWGAEIDEDAVAEYAWRGL